MTATLGLTAYPTDSEDSLAMVDVTNRALYLEKQQGGNQVCAAPGQSPKEPQAA